MSRKLKIIVSSLTAVIIIALVSSLYPASSSYPYPGGLLNGVSFTAGPEMSYSTETTSVLTDGYITTSYTLGKYGSEMIRFGINLIQLHRLRLIN